MKMNQNTWVDYMYNLTGIDKNILAQEYSNHIQNRKVEIYNSASGRTMYPTSTEFFNKLDSTQLIVENGAIFSNHDQGVALPAVAITSLKAVRNAYKGEMKKAKSVGNAIDAIIYNNSQSDTKVSMNTFYGIQANVYSKFYNYDIACSITARGRGTVSVNGLNLEYCFGSYRPYSVVALLQFIEVNRTKYVDREILDKCRIPEREELLRHIIKRPNIEEYYGYQAIFDKVNTLTSDELIKVFYANNFAEFIRIPFIKSIIRKVLTYQNEDILKIKDLPTNSYKKYIFLDSLNPPERIKIYIDTINQYVSQLLVGFSWFEGDIDDYGEEYDAPEFIFKNIEREIVVLTDTDSLIVTLEPSMKKIMAMYDDFEEITNNMDKKFKDFILGMIVISMINVLIERILWKYTEQSLIPVQWRHIIAYKQEFFFRTLQTTFGAKNYLAVISIQEGVFLPDEEIEIKGLSLKKTNFNKYLSERAKHIAVNMIAKKIKPDIRAIFKEVQEVRRTLPEIFRTPNNLDIFVVNKLSTGYGVTPIGDARYKAIELYNVLYDAKINIPGSFLVCKLDLSDKEDMIQSEYPDIYVKLVNLTEERKIKYTMLSVKNRAIKLWLTEDRIPEFVKDIMADMESITNSEELKLFINNIKKVYKEHPQNDELITNWVTKLTMKNLKIKDIDRIAIPLDSETVPAFITKCVDINAVAEFENLIAVLIKGLGFEVIRNQEGKQMIHNILSYY